MRFGSLLLQAIVTLFYTLQCGAVEPGKKTTVDSHLPPGITEPPSMSDSVSGGKVRRRKLADIPLLERPFAEEKLKEFTEAVTGPKASPLCKNINVFCRVNVSDGYVGFLTKYPTQATGDLISIGALKVSLAELKNSRFTKLTLLGYFAEGIGSKPPWSSVARLFKDGDGNLAYLSEWDFVSDDGGIEQADEFMNAKVGKYDASAMQSISSTGRSLWDVTWVDLPKQIKLYYFCASTNCISQAGILRLANSIYDRK